MIKAKNLDKPDEQRDMPKGHMDVVEVGEVTFGRATFEPGWRWSESVKPIAGTDSCEFSHNGYVEKGHMHIRMDNGEEADLGPGDAFVATPGHDAWVVGDEKCVVYDFAGQSAEYAKPKS
ncbi:cupin [Wenjunlia tyrosinilytica]|uniref:Cupin n=2 Tax=Wenjunlia tyrosinilytica TaxID=1544741 RepID=A0A917ZR12_9ACTN|nr:cupin domain-containing protein [Wenjunlia tyrosinilytica]GGO88790.1 cupin [Wenjunlia tyrosinilytica]